MTTAAKTTPDYLVVWQDDGPHIQSKVSVGTCDPQQMTNNDWVKAAALSEGYSFSDADDLIEKGYELLLVCIYPAAFYDQ